MTSALVPIGSFTLGSSQATVSFTNLPQSFVDLVLICNYAHSSGGGSPQLRINGDAGSNYTEMTLTSYSTSSMGSWVSSNRSDLQPMGYTGISANEIGYWKVEFLRYKDIDKQKSILWKSGHTGELDVGSARWYSLNAITSFSVTATGNFNVGSRFDLYGVLG